MVLPEKKTYGYRERDEEKRTEFILRIRQKKVKERVHVDESGIDNREDYGYGWNEKGQRFYDLKSGKRSLYCEYDKWLMPRETDSAPNERKALVTVPCLSNGYLTNSYLS